MNSSNAALDVMYLDSKKLTDAITLCFKNARDIENFTTEQRTQWLIRGKVLRGLLINLLSASFAEESFDEVTNANQKLKKIVKQLKDKQLAIEKFNETIKKLTEVATTLEKLIGLASFV